MRFINLKLPTLRLIRFLVAVCVCALLVFSSGFAAYAASPNPTSSSKLNEGEAPLNDIYKKSEDILSTDKPFSRQAMQEEANSGLNEVQGSADVDLMKRPDNSQASSIEEKVKDVLEAVPGVK